jgi:hypothetical protein
VLRVHGSFWFYEFFLIPDCGEVDYRFCRIDV